MISKSLLQVRQRQCIACICVRSQYVIFRTNTSCFECSDVWFAEFWCLVGFEVQTGVKPHGWQYVMKAPIFDIISIHKRYWTSFAFSKNGIIYASGTWNKSVSPLWFLKYTQWISLCVCVCVLQMCIGWSGMARRLDAKCRWWCE